MLFWQLVNEPRRHRRLPLAIHTSIGRKGDRANFFGAGYADIGQPALFLEALLTAFIHRTLRRK